MKNKIFVKKMNVLVPSIPFDFSKFHSIQESSKRIPKMHIDDFDWIGWRDGIAIWRELGVACKQEDIYDQAKILRHFAIGYFPGERLGCRPKENETAVAFIVNDIFCWTHLRNEEFYHVFNI